MQPLPNTLSPLTLNGRVISPWVEYLQQFTIAPPPIITIKVTGSIFKYIGKEPGNLVVTDGTISQISLTRGNVTINFGAGTNKIIPVGIKDTISITYSVLPTLQFIPSYGQNTNR